MELLVGADGEQTGVRIPVSRDRAGRTGGLAVAHDGDTPALIGGSLRDGSILEVLGGASSGAPGWGRGGVPAITRSAHTSSSSSSNPSGMRTGSEEVTSQISLTGPNAFEASASFDLFDAAGEIIGQGCVINETATRFE
jgi:hypothetical protein